MESPPLLVSVKYLRVLSAIAYVLAVLIPLAYMFVYESPLGGFVLGFVPMMVAIGFGALLSAAANSREAIHRLETRVVAVMEKLGTD